MIREDRISLALLLMRLGVFLVMLMWTLDKFINPDHATLVFDAFYGISIMKGNLLIALAVAELVIITGFVFGYKKRLTYGLVFLFHAVSTLSSWQQYLQPWDNLLFFAAWPMLAACFALYLLRDLDTRWTLS